MTYKVGDYVAISDPAPGDHYLKKLLGSVGVVSEILSGYTYSVYATINGDLLSLAPKELRPATQEEILLYKLTL